jgi:hypothetical protein
MRAKWERAIWWKQAAQTCSVVDSSASVPVPMLKCHNPLVSYFWEKVHCKYTMHCTVLFIINLFHVGIVSLCVIYQLNLTPDIVFNIIKEMCGACSGWDNALQTGSLQDRLPMVSLEFFIHIILPAAQWHCGWLSL